MSSSDGIPLLITQLTGTLITPKTGEPSVHLAGTNFARFTMIAQVYASSLRSPLLLSTVQL
jgi:hypothetical protein